MAGPTTKGVLLGAASAACYGVNPLFALPLYSAGLTTDSVLFYRYAFAVVMLGVMMRMQGQSFRLRRKEVAPLAVMGLLFSFSSLCLFESYHYMDAGIASTLLFVYPVLVAVIMATVFHERVSLITVFSILLASAGILLLCRTEGGGMLSPLGITFVALSSLAYAIYIVGVNRSVLATLPITKLTFYALLFGILVYVVRLEGCTQLQAIPAPHLWVNVLSLAALPTVVSLVAMSKAIHFIGSTPTAILGALEPVTALFFGVTVFGEPLTGRILLGVALVILAVTLIVGGKPIKKFFKLKIES